MKKWLYFIVPGILTVIFTFFYLTHSKEAAEKERIRKEQVALVQAEEAAKKAEIEAKAREDAAKRAAEREAEAAAKEAERVAKWEAEGQRIQADTDQYNAEADKLSHDISELQVTLDSLYRTKERTNDEVLQLAKRVERARIDGQTADLEIQRLTEMIVRRADASSLTRLPAAAPSR
ncbi:MAG: hypothetical protein H3C27_00320 [Opitutaceae bacterium]|nr:hypothetical protein [Opitutaceae bacterium]